jgi:hypothetical protein
MSEKGADFVSPATLRGRRLTEERKGRGEQRLNDWIDRESAQILEGMVKRYRHSVDAKASRGEVLEALIKGSRLPGLQ